MRKSSRPRTSSSSSCPERACRDEGHTMIPFRGRWQRWATSDGERVWLKLLRHVAGLLRDHGTAAAHRSLFTVLVLAVDLHDYQRSFGDRPDLRHAPVRGNHIAGHHGLQEFEIDRPCAAELVQ